MIVVSKTFECCVVIIVVVMNAGKMGGNVCGRWRAKKDNSHNLFIRQGGRSGDGKKTRVWCVGVYNK